jgi:hypothetical protein
MAHAAPPPVLINDVRLPLDLNAIGLNFTLTPASVAELDNPVLILPLVSTVPVNNLDARFINGKIIFKAHAAALAGSYITIDGVTYRVIAHAGNGTYGATCIVARDIDGVREKRFVLKEQNSSAVTDIAFVKEAIINHVIYQATSPPNGAAAGNYKPFAGQVHKLFYSVRDGFKRIYCLIDLLAIDAHKYLQASVMDDADIFSRSAAIYNIFKQYIYRLRQLYEMYKYSHGDFKPDNVMFDHADNLRLIDFGFSKITLKDTADIPIPITIITNPEFNNLDNTSQDNTNMAAFIRMTHNLGLAGPPMVLLSSYHFIRGIVYGYGRNLTACREQGGVYCNIVDAAGVITHSYHLAGIGDMYKICDLHENPAGTFDSVIAALEAVPPAAAPAALPEEINPSQRGFALPLLEGPIVAGPPVVGVVIGGAKLKYRNKTKRNSKKNDPSGKQHHVTRKHRQRHR